MFETPYQTTPCARFSLEKTTAGIRRLEIDERLVRPEGTPNDVALVPVGVTEFLPFQQPMTRKEIPSLGYSVVVDGRSLLKTDGTPAKQDVFQHAMRIAKLTHMWYTGDQGTRRDLLNIGELPMKVFINWVVGAISLRLGLDFGQTSLLRAVTAVYFIQLHTPLSHDPVMADVDRLLTRAAQRLPGVDAKVLKDLLGDIPPLNNITDYVNWAIKVIDSPRMEQLTVAALNSFLGYTFGPAYREAAAVALEYPPTFLGLVYSAVEERSYSKTGLGKVVERTISRGNDKEFVKNMNYLIK